MGEVRVVEGLDVIVRRMSSDLANAIKPWFPKAKVGCEYISLIGASEIYVKPHFWSRRGLLFGITHGRIQADGRNIKIGVADPRLLKLAQWASEKYASTVDDIEIQKMYY